MEFLRRVVTIIHERQHDLILILLTDTASLQLLLISLLRLGYEPVVVVVRIGGDHLIAGSSASSDLDLIRS